MGQKRKQIVADVVTVSGATTSTIVSYDLANNNSGINFSSCSILAEAKLIGRETTTGDVANAASSAVFKIASGILTQVGATTAILPIITSAALTGVVLTLDSNGTVIRLRASSLVDLNIEYEGYLTLYIN